MVEVKNGGNMGAALLWLVLCALGEYDGRVCGLQFSKEHMKQYQDMRVSLDCGLLLLQFDLLVLPGLKAITSSPVALDSSASAF